MRNRHIVAVAALMALVGCGLSPAEQRAADTQGCVGYGFAPGSDAFAHCMMTTAQQRADQQAADRRAREAQAAADARQRSLEATIAQKKPSDDAKTATSSTDASISAIPSIPAMPDNLVCTSAQIGNAGSASCHSP